MRIERAVKVELKSTGEIQKPYVMTRDSELPYISSLLQDPNAAALCCVLRLVLLTDTPHIYSYSLSHRHTCALDTWNSGRMGRESSGERRSLSPSGGPSLGMR